MSVNSYLIDLGSSLVLSDTEKEKIDISINAIKNNLDRYFGSNVIEKKVYGSYVRSTILPRKADENSDIDLMVVFNNSEGYKPQAFLNRLKNFAESYYSRSEIYQSNPTVVLELSHIKFELTPAYIDYGKLYYIPKDQSNWMYTDPDGFYDELTNCNKMNNYRIKPIIRIIKHWNIQKNYRDVKSYQLEKKIAEEMRYEYFSCSSYTDYLLSALNKIKYMTDTNRINKTIECINDALNYEKNNMPYSALSRIKDFFPEV